MGVKKEYPNRDFYLKLIGTGITLLGFAVIIYQMFLFQTQNESLQEQSELLNRSLLQTYRPIGYLYNKNPDSPSKKYEYVVLEWKRAKRTTKDTIVISYMPYLINEGSGVLVYIGHLNFMTNEEWSFRERIQKGLMSPDQIQFDWNHSRVRQASLLPKKFNIIRMQVKNTQDEDMLDTYVQDGDLKVKKMDKNPFFYLYTLTLYEDQDGNLYDTETILYFEIEFINDLFSEAIITKQHHHDLYSAYSDEEKSILLKFIGKRGHPMVKYFSENTQAEQKAVKP